MHRATVHNSVSKDLATPNEYHRRRQGEHKCIVVREGSREGFDMMFLCPQSISDVESVKTKAPMTGIMGICVSPPISVPYITKNIPLYQHVEGSAAVSASCGISVSQYAVEISSYQQLAICVTQHTREVGIKKGFPFGPPSCARGGVLIDKFQIGISSSDNPTRR
jgi:hypothetical protein